MKIAIVVQRYGADLSGGAELHARYIAEHLSRHIQVDILTTCARDYITWRNEFSPGQEIVDGITVRRFPVVKERATQEFGSRSRRVFENQHSLADELAWLDSEGPTSPALIRYIRDHERDYDRFVFFSYRYYHAYHGIRAVARRSLLVPTAERDAALGLGIFPPIFRGVRALMYNIAEEQAMIQALAHNTGVPHVIVGVGSRLPDRVDPQDFRQTRGIQGPYVIYIGRIDENKGCRELFLYFQQYARMTSSRLSLLLVGTALLEIPDHPRIRHLGYLTDQEKFDALAGADAAHHALVLRKPLDGDARGMGASDARCSPTGAATCCVVRWSGAGPGCITRATPSSRKRFVRSKRTRRSGPRSDGTDEAYFRDNYTWPIVERKYLDMLNRLAEDDAAGRQPPDIEPLPGWFARRRPTLAPSREIVDRVPIGPAFGTSATGAVSR